jgi:hypothetical protein
MQLRHRLSTFVHPWCPFWSRRSVIKLGQEAWLFVYLFLNGVVIKVLILVFPYQGCLEMSPKLHLDLGSQNTKQLTRREGLRDGHGLSTFLTIFDDEFPWGDSQRCHMARDRHLIGCPQMLGITQISPSWLTYLNRAIKRRKAGWYAVLNFCIDL